MGSQAALALESEREETTPLSAVQSNVPAFFGALRQEIQRTWAMLMFILHEKKGSNPLEAALALPFTFEMPYSRAQRERIRFIISALRILLLSMPIPITTVGALSYQKYHLSGEQVSYCPECAAEVEKLASCILQLRQVHAYLASNNPNPLLLGGTPFSREDLRATYLPYWEKLGESIATAPMKSARRKELLGHWGALCPSYPDKDQSSPRHTIIPAINEAFL